MLVKELLGSKFNNPNSIKGKKEKNYKYYQLIHKFLLIMS